MAAIFADWLIGRAVAVTCFSPGPSILISPPAVINLDSFSNVPYLEILNFWKFWERENFNFLKRVENNLFIVTNDLKQNHNDDWTCSFMNVFGCSRTRHKIGVQNGKFKSFQIFLRKNYKEVYYSSIIFENIQL